jgi:hypothetical protein
VPATAFNDAEHTYPPGIASTSTPKPWRTPELLGELRGDHWAELHDRVVALALDASRPDHEPLRVEREIGGVEEVDLADLRVDRVELERIHRGALVGLGHGQLQLDAIGPLHQMKQVAELLVGERGTGGGGGHVGPLCVGSNRSSPWRREPLKGAATTVAAGARSRARPRAGSLRRLR